MGWTHHNKRNLIIITSILLSAGFLVTSLASYYISRASIRRTIIELELPLTANAVYSEIQKELVRPVLISQMMADDTFLRHWVLGKEKDVREITRYLKQIKIRFNAVTSFFVSEKSRIYYYSEGILKKVNEAEWRDSWYFRVRRMEKPYEVNVDFDIANQDAMTIFINYRVYDFNSGFIGATGVGLPVASVKRLIDDYQQKYRQRIFFINREGRVLLHAGNEKWEEESIREIDGLSTLSDRILTEKSGSFRYNDGDGLKFLNVRFIPEFGWHLCVEKPEKEAISKIRNVLFLNIGIFLAVTTLFLILSGMIINRYQSQLEKLAVTDKLTGLYNRQAFDVLIEQLMQNYRRTKTGFSIALFDIDDFKHVNDTAGHLNGDRVLVEIASIAKKRIRGGDIICRWGGEEFLLALPGCPLLEAFSLTEEIRIAVADRPIDGEAEKIRVTISAGVAELSPEETIDQLIKRADQALYNSKKTGKNKSSL